MTQLENNADSLQPKRIDRSDLLNHRLFWGVYYYDHQFHEDLEAFGISDDNFDAVRREMPEITGEEPGFFACYSIHLPLTAGCSVIVEFEAYPEDPATVFYLNRVQWSEPLLLCRLSGSGDMPSLRWEEALLIAESAQNTAAMPLLFPGVWLTPNDDREQVREHLFNAWKSLDAAKPADLNPWVSTMMEHQLIEETVETLTNRGTETVEERWFHDSRLGWVNNSSSPRNPEFSPPEHFDKIKEFFSALS